MGRKSNVQIGDIFGGLKVLEIIPSNQTGKHVRLNCLCMFCGKETIINSIFKSKFNSCGCQQNNSKTWKSIGPKTMPWKLPLGESAFRNKLHQYKKSAIRRNLPFSLSEQEFRQLITGPCRYCGRRLTATAKGQGKTSGDFPYTGVDRLDSNIGYNLDNAVSCCWDCNNMKSNMTEEVFLDHIRRIYQFTFLESLDEETYTSK